MAIGGYSISGYWLLFIGIIDDYQWPLVVINGYFINGY
jgi:hypothetical protein